MPASEYDLSIEQGATYQIAFTYKDDAGVAQDLTDYTARMQVRASVSAPDVLLELTTENGRIAISGAEGRIDLVLTAAITTGITWSRGVYDLEIVSPAGEVRRLLRGRVTVSREVTR